MRVDFEGAAYQQASGLQRLWGTRLLDETELRGDEAVLDLGCGDGTLTTQWADRLPGGSVVGVDISLGMIHYAREANWRPNVTYRIEDIESIRRESQIYDVVVSNAALHWIHDHERLLPKLYDMLRNDGILRLSFGALGNCRTFFSVARQAMTLPAFAGHFVDFTWPWRNETVDGYRRLMSGTRFRDVKVWGQNADDYFATEQQITAWMDQPLLVPFLNHLPEHLHGDFRRVVVNRMLEVSRRADGTFFEYFRKINVRARRSVA